MNALIGILLFVGGFCAANGLVRFMDGKPTDWLLLGWAALCIGAAVAVWAVARKYGGDDQ